MGKRTAIATLTHTAQAGPSEALFAFNRETGEQLAYSQSSPGNPNEVLLNPQLLAGHANVAVLHNHRDASPPGADDWANFLSVPAFQEMVIVTTEHVYTLTKPPEWMASRQSESFKRTFCYFLAKIEFLRRAVACSNKFVDLTATVREALLWETNQWMAGHFGIRLTREDTR